MNEATDPWRPMAQCPELRPGEYLVAYDDHSRIPAYRRVAFWDGWRWRSGANGSVIRDPDHIYRPDDGPIWEALRG